MRTRRRTISGLAYLVFCLTTMAHETGEKKRMKYYCEYCGTARSSVNSLTASTCPRHPEGSHKGRHKLYEGNEKSKYTCKYCGTSRTSIASLTASTCPRHPKGSHKGRHAPAL